MPSLSNPRTWSGAQVTHLIATAATELESTRSLLNIYPRDHPERKLLLSTERYLVLALENLRAIQQAAEAREIRERMLGSGV